MTTHQGKAMTPTQPIPVDVVICIYVPTAETFELVRRCIQSVIDRTLYPHRLLLLDDCSPYGNVPALLQGFQAMHPEREIVWKRNPKNLGFVATANHGISLGAGRDVVLLNNDTEVTTGWLSRMARAAYSSQRVATVTPFSNNATFASIPKMDVENPLPPGLSPEDVARIVFRHSPGTTPEVPTGHGFCLYVRRSALDEVGSFDEQNFGSGYGEENDFCCRCSERGWIHVLDDLTFVWHRGEASFQGSRGDVTHRHFQKLIELHPWFYERIKSFEEGDPLLAHRQLIGTALARAVVPPVSLEANARGPRKHVLSINVRGGTYNGLVRYTEELSAELAGDVDSFSLTSSGRVLTLGLQGAPVAWRHTLPEALGWTRLSGNRAYREIVGHWMDLIGVDVLHVNSLEGHASDVIDLAAARGIPIVLVVHDFLLVCPSKFLLDASNNFCGVCACGEERAGCLEHNPSLGAEPGSAAMLQAYRERIRKDVLPRLATVVAPSHSAATVLSHHYPELVGRVRVIEHELGSSPLRPDEVAGAVRSGTRLHSAFLGALHPVKGLDEARALIAHAPWDQHRFSLLGPTNEAINGLQRLGTYDYREVAQQLRKHAVDVVLLFSRAHETFGYTLSEALSAGIPVIVHDVGALAERVRALKCGWVVDAKDTQSVVGLLSRLRSEPEMLRDARSRIASLPRSSVTRMAAAYGALYSQFPVRDRPAHQVGGTQLMFTLHSPLPPPARRPPTPLRAELDQSREALAQTQRALDETLGALGDAQADLQQLRQRLAVKVVERLKSNRGVTAVIESVRGPLARLLRV